MAQNCLINVLEDSHVSPPPGSVPTTSIPLTFFDTMWVSCCHMQRLFFYEFPYPTSHFMQNSLPNLKNSLSLALQHFFPFAGNLKWPPRPQRPYIQYTDGDSVLFVVTESTAEFKHLTGNGQIPRRGHELEDLVPKLAPPSMCSDGDSFCKQQPLMAIQVSIFPYVGISIGVTFCHVAADGKAFGHFTKSWASICRSEGDLTFVDNYPPDYSRDLIQDPRGIWSIFLKEMSNAETSTRMNRNDNVRITPVISKTQVEMLKKWIARKFVEENEKQDPPRLSTFVVTTAVMWVCLIKLHLSKKTPDNGICRFLFPADCRDRLRLPKTYFGNCLTPCIATARRNELTGENGIFVAANAIGREIQEFEKEPLKGIENWISSAKEVLKECEHLVSLAGSPKLRVYETEFGFGRPTKSEVVHIGSRGSISISESRDGEGAVEFGLSLAPYEFHKFNAIFEQFPFN
ncbi:coumaroyl-CoA:anthocyanidin 3-O-glucoside-6''-O-coumaroyltransferase 1-like [Durio zibethinus]|uniref:Coumaroyl-CoA:anthocyanidin 3-O-glucoside-6''-O-coumaroyltransferase 1-like n=1 Tax=Durio zibethinus TaxID=66656 RepID=A0A6P6A875_DURZI|nr:coumaroyl-CoA:anthocyanidin 3-O-glucoside-6''-O-coumaroyltransferase 1-like [Durio zibethinus]